MGSDGFLHRAGEVEAIGSLHDPDNIRFYAQIGWLYAYGREQDAALGPRGLSRFKICAIGLVKLGGLEQVIGVVPHRQEIVLGIQGSGNEDGKLRLLPQIHCLHPAPPPDLQKAELEAWANRILPRIESALLPPQEASLAGARRYHIGRYRDVLALAFEAAKKRAKDVDYPIYKEDLAAGCAPGWLPEDLLEPMRPTQLHALLAALSLGMVPQEARLLISLAALIEWGFNPYKGDDPTDARYAEADALYASARQLARAACPAWDSHGIYTPWRSLRAREVHPASLLEALTQNASQAAIARAEKTKKGEPAPPEMIRLGPAPPFNDAPHGEGIKETRTATPSWWSGTPTPLADSGEF